MSQLEAVKQTPNTLEGLHALCKFFDELKAVDAALPFDLLPSLPIASKESDTVSLFELPKLSQLSQGEEFIWQTFLDLIDFDHFTNNAASQMRLVAVTIIMMFRYDTAWSIGKTMQLGATQVENLYKFFLGERTGWPKPEIAAVPDADAETETKTEPEKKTRSSSGRKPSGDSATSSPTTDASVTEPLAAAG